MESAEEYLRTENLDDALKHLQNQVRNDPSNVKHRIFLFQLLAVLGQWDRALTQLNVAGEMDAGTLAMVQMYRQALQSEAFREQVFKGSRAPLIFGEPEQWIALIINALKLTAEGNYAQSQDLRAQAFESAPMTSGTIDDSAFEWIADADTRFGPFLEAIVNGNYFWIPFHRIKSITFDAPEDLRDLVWMPAYFTWANGGETVGLVPTRYPDSQNNEDVKIRLSKKTDWEECASDVFVGLGQRMFATDAGEYPIMDVREVKLNTGLEMDVAENVDDN
jgi:type VI secretion system protein ImpE